MSPGVRLGMLYVPALTCILAAAPVWAQDATRSEALGYHKACISQASSSSSIIKSGGRSIYTCGGSVAQTYFDYLVSINAAQTIDKQRTGTYIFREIPQEGRCWHKIHEIDSISIYGCSISVAGSPS